MCSTTGQLQKARETEELSQIGETEDMLTTNGHVGSGRRKWMAEETSVKFTPGLPFELTPCYPPGCGHCTGVVSDNMRGPGRQYVVTLHSSCNFSVSLKLF